jgi:hypothetical protein
MQANAAEALCACFSRLLVDVQYRHAAAGTCQPLSRRGTESGGTTGDDGRQSVKAHGRVPSERSA